MLIRSFHNLLLLILLFYYHLQTFYLTSLLFAFSATISAQHGFSLEIRSYGLFIILVIHPFQNSYLSLSQFDRLILNFQHSEVDFSLIFIKILFFIFVSLDFFRCESNDSTIWFFVEVKILSIHAFNFLNELYLFLILEHFILVLHSFKY